MQCRDNHFEAGVRFCLPDVTPKLACAWSWRSLLASQVIEAWVGSHTSEEVMAAMNEARVRARTLREAAGRPDMRRWRRPQP